MKPIINRYLLELIWLIRLKCLILYGIKWFFVEVKFRQIMRSQFINNHRNQFIYFLLFLFLILFAIFPLQAAKKTIKATPDPAELLQKGREAFFKYDFDSAAEAFAEYQALIKKKKMEPDEEAQEFERALNIAENALDRVEKIVIVDSLSFPEEVFYKSYRLAKSAGSLKSGNELEDNPGIRKDKIAYINERNDYILWSEPDENGFEKIKEANKFLDGKWYTEEIILGEDENVNYSYPFMTSDGQTMYFSSDGEGSMGGYDIFVVQRDALTGEFRQPLNIGMPYNSPYDDIMMAIDEESGLGWWATDRNSPDGSITVYIYLINDIRHNYSADTDDLVSYAMLSDYKATQPEEKREDINRILKNLPKNEEKPSAKSGTFKFQLSKDKIYTEFSDFRNKRAADQMALYLKKEKELETLRVELEKLRKGEFKKNKTNIKDEITLKEAQMESLKKEADSIRKEIYRLEKAKR